MGTKVEPYPLPYSKNEVFKSGGGEKAYYNAISKNRVAYLWE